MNTIKSNIKLLAITTILAFSITSCKESESTKIIKNLEKCLGNIKTEKDANKLSKTEAIEIAECMLPYLENTKDMVNKLEGDEKENFIKEVEAETEKSEYKEIIKKLNYKTVKRLVESNNSDTYSNSEYLDTENYDELLDNYESYVDKYLEFLKKVNSENMGAMEDYPELLEKAEDLEKSLKEADNKKQLTKRQMKRLMKIQTKMLNASIEMQ